MLTQDKPSVVAKEAAIAKAEAEAKPAPAQGAKPTAEAGANKKK